MERLIVGVQCNDLSDSVLVEDKGIDLNMIKNAMFTSEWSEADCSAAGGLCRRTNP